MKLIKNVTTITFPGADEYALQKAIRFYGYSTLNHFIRAAGYTLIRHHKAKDRLLSPLAFNSATPRLNLVKQAK
jgi:hypothetical protein